MLRILKYYNQHLKLMQDASVIIKSKKSKQAELHYILRELIYSITNQKGSFNIFFDIYLKAHSDGTDEDTQEFTEEFKMDLNDIREHINRSSIYLNFKIADKTKLIDYDEILKFDLKKYFAPIKCTYELSAKELITKINEYISISVNCIHYYFYILPAQFDEVEYLVGNHLEDKRADALKESQSKKATLKDKKPKTSIKEKTKAQYIESIKDISEEDRLQQNRNMYEMFEKLNDFKSEDSKKEFKNLPIAKVEEDNLGDVSTKLDIDELPLEVKKINKPKKAGAKKGKDKSFYFDITHNEVKEELIKFIRKTSVEKGFFDDVSSNERLIDILFSNDLILDNFKQVYFSLETTKITSFVHFIMSYFKAGLRKKIERSELFISERGNLLDAQNLYSTKKDEIFLKQLNKEYIDFKRNLKEKEKKH